MSFGLTNAPVAFQAIINDIFRPYLRKFILVFFHNILIYNKELQEHNEHLALVLAKLKENQLFAKKNKCELD
jgi:Reverse transcriptase (RNA-dependent DNA polymerase)